MLNETVRSSFLNQGEICLCGSRIFVEKPIYEKFKKAFVDKVKQQRIGDPKEAETKVGAIVSRLHFDKVMSYIALAKEEGGNILCGGKTFAPEGRCKDGWFIEPTVIEGLSYEQNAIFLRGDVADDVFRVALGGLVGRDVADEAVFVLVDVDALDLLDRLANRWHS